MTVDLNNKDKKTFLKAIEYLNKWVKLYIGKGIPFHIQETIKNLSQYIEDNKYLMCD